MALEEWETEVDHIKRHPEPISPSPDNLTALKADFKSMLTTSQDADFSLTSGGMVLRVHKFVLRARSPVFAKMFATPMEESKKNAVGVTDLDPSVLEEFVEFLYTGQMPNHDFESGFSLYPAADKYDVKSLGKTCRDIMLSKLDVQNAPRVLVLADQHSDVVLKDATMEFILSNFDSILKTEMWDEFVADKTALATEVLRNWKCKRNTKVNAS